MRARDLPTWAPRVKQRDVRRLYATDAKGIYDEELIDEVGYGLLARCQSFIQANEAREGCVRCPRCSATVTHAGGKEEVLRCDCGWELIWGEYFETIQHAQLSGAGPVLKQFRAFIKAFPATRTPQEKMLAIDRLIHGFHYFLKTNQPTRPVAVNLIEGRLRQVVAFLDELTYGKKSSPGTRETYAEWSAKIDVHPDWYPSRRKSNEDEG
ncbi:MAG: hypothetical protein U9R48_09785 [Chloroflexota bacterium]|nr:hypothetical protein [Chloroflexota bacterium]